MRELLLACLLAASAFAQTGKFGAFTNSDDVGAPPLKGSAEFDAATGQYKITGTGTDIWAKADQFHYVWREMSGNFAVTATAKFLTDGIAHRKAVIMLRKSLDTDSPFVHLAIHGDGTPVGSVPQHQGRQHQHGRFPDRRSGDVEAEAGPAGHHHHGVDCQGRRAVEGTGTHR